MIFYLRAHHIKKQGCNFIFMKFQNVSKMMPPILAAVVPLTLDHPVAIAANFNEHY